MSITVELNGAHRDRYADLAKDTEDIIQDSFRAIADIFYAQLEAAYYWRNEDSEVDVNIIANEYTFTIEGKRA